MRGATSELMSWSWRTVLLAFAVLAAAVASHQHPRLSSFADTKEVTPFFNWQLYVAPVPLETSTAWRVVDGAGVDQGLGWADTYDAEELFVFLVSTTNLAVVEPDEATRRFSCLLGFAEVPVDEYRIVRSPATGVGEGRILDPAVTTIDVVGRPLDPKSSVCDS